MFSKAEAFSITIDGRMNPRIHHPTWYQLTGSLSKEEMEASVEKGNLIVSSTLSEFHAPKFSVICQRERWEIHTKMQDARARILGIALKTFDDLLPQTSVQAFQFRFLFSFTAPHENTAAFLAKLMKEMVPVESRSEIAVQVAYTTTEPTKRRKVEVRSVPAHGNKVWVKHKFIYSVEKERIFTLRQMSLLEDYELDYEEAVAQTEELAYKLNKVTYKDSRGSADFDSN